MEKPCKDFYPFKVGEKYKRKDIYRIIGVPINTKGGNWDTGYNQYKDDWFIFCNIDSAGRTGHNYDNQIIENRLIWYGKTNSEYSHPSIKSIIDPSRAVYIFARTKNDEPFDYLGRGKVLEVFKQVPVKIIWQLVNDDSFYDEVIEPEKYIEGSTKSISVNVYERNHAAREQCIRVKGKKCSVCGLDFEEVYGEIGMDFIHVHHLVLLSSIGKAYELDPIRDLSPVCPNCHAMLHKKNPPISIEELQSIIKQRKKC